MHKLCSIILILPDAIKNTSFLVVKILYYESYSIFYLLNIPSKSNCAVDTMLCITIFMTFTFNSRCGVLPMSNISIQIINSTLFNVD